MHRAISLDVCDYTNTLMCNLYDSTNDISGQATNVIVHTERNGFKELRFSLPSVDETGAKNYRLNWLIADYKIRLRTVKQIKTSIGTSTSTEIDWFLISESKVIHNNFSNNYDIKASHISQLLNTKNLGLEFSDTEGNNTGTIKEIAATILEGTGWHLGYVAQFMEEDKYIKTGTKKEKVRSFKCSSKTGAFKMMNDLCEMFDAKPIYHGEGTYTDENGQTQTGRTVDIIPMNPFSKDLAEGAVPEEVLNGENVVALYYDKNVSNITRTLNTDHLVSVLSAYGSYGELDTGIVSLQTCEHAEITFGTLNAGTYHFEYLDGQYYFTTNRKTTGLKWSYIDLISRTYVFNGTYLFKVTKEAPASYTTITGTLKYVKNYLSFIMDFSYYQKIGLLTDEHLLEIARLQWDLPKKYEAAQNASLALSAAKAELSRTASAGEGFLMFDVESMDMNKGNVRLKLKKTDEHPDGVIYRSDYDEARRNYFSWTTAKSMVSANKSVGARGAVFYIVHNTTPTSWEKAYLKSVGTTTYDYYRDDLNNIYALTSERHFDHKSYEASDPSGTFFPDTGEPGYIYVADDTNKMYVWNAEKYMEIKASGYYYGINEFEYPDTVTLWTTTSGAWTEGDKVYMFSADSIAGLFGPREDQIAANKERVESETKSAGTTAHPVVFIDENGAIPSVSICGEDGYAWYYKSVSTSYSFGTLYFCYAGAGDQTWKKVYVSDKATDGEEVAYVSGYDYYYSRRKQYIYKHDNSVYKRMDNNYEEKEIKKAFAHVIEACNTHDKLTKGLKDRYNYSGTAQSLKGNYAFKGEFDNYFLFSTGSTTIPDSSKVYYDVSTSKVWIDNDQSHILTARVYNTNALTFPVANAIDGVSYGEGSFVDDVIKQTGNKFISPMIDVFDNTEYSYSLPSGSVVVCQDSKGKTIDSFNASPFTTPNHTAKVQLVCPSKPTSSHYFRVRYYSSMFFISGVGYKILSCTGAGERTGMTYLMDRFIELSEEVYEDKVPSLKSYQKEITDSITHLSNQLGDMYREGWWQEPKYVEGDEQQLYADALENLNEISHPEATYDVTYLDLYGSDNNLSASVDIDWPDVDITCAAHLVDEDIETNRWAYIDSIDKCYDQPWKTQIQINTKLSMIGQQSFTDVLAKIAEVANQVKAKQTVYENAKYIGSAGQIAADRLEGLIQANKVYLLGGTSNWYTDEKGNIIFEAADGNSVMMLTGRGLMISNSRDANGDWEWRVAVSGLGINADVIAAGEFSAKHIIAGTITTDKLSSAVGQELEIGSNKALALYATVDGERPSGSLLTLHPKSTDSWIAIGAASGDQPAYVDIKSGGIVNIEAGSKLNLVSGDQLFISVDRTLQDEIDESIIETVRVYKNGTSKTTAPALASGSKQYPNFGTLDSSWKIDVQPVTTTNKYLWSRDRYKRNSGTYSYSAAIYEGELSNKVATDHPEYIRTKANASAPSATASGWSASIPTLADGSDLVWVWVCDAVTNTNGEMSRTNIRHDSGLDTVTNATLTALNIASGKIGVPKVDATGIYIADNLLQVKSTGRVDVLGNASVNIGTSSSNSAVILNKDGISIATQKNLAIASGGKLTVNSSDIFIGTDRTLQAEINETIVETVRVYRNGTSSSTAPALSSTAGVYPDFGTNDTNWKTNVQPVTSTNKYLWSRDRYKRKEGTYSFGAAIYEGELSSKVATDHPEYIRTKKDASAPSATATGWSSSIPPLESGSNLVWVWVCDAVTNTNGDTTRKNIRHDSGLDSITNAALTAVNIATGAVSVPKVDSTGISIADNLLQVKSTGQIDVIGNGCINIGTASSNSAVVLNKDGISIGSGADIGIVAGGTVTIGTGGTNLFKFASDNKGGTDKNINRAYLYNGVTGITDTSHNGIYLGTDGMVLGKGVFKVTNTGALTATSATIEGKITATSGKIAGWTIGSSTIYNYVYADGSTTEYTKGVGMGTGTYAFYTGRTNTMSSTADCPFYVKNDGTLKATKATITGSITASSFELTGDAAIPPSKVTGLTNAKVTYTYVVSTNGTTPPSTGWLDNRPSPVDKGKYLWTKIYTVNLDGTNTTAYNCEYYPNDGSKGNPGAYITTVLDLYNLNTSKPSKPTTSTTIETTDVSKKWTTLVPTYIDGYDYYRSAKYTYSDNTVQFADVYVDYGLSVANEEAKSAANTVDPFKKDGLTWGTTWGGVTYGVCLTGSSYSRPMLIGSNKGITIAKSATSGDGAAVVINESGIKMHAASFTVTTTKSTAQTQTNALDMSTDGIKIYSGAKIEIKSGASFTVASSNFNIDTSGNVTVKGKVTATSGAIANWTIGSNFIANGESVTKSSVGIGDSTYTLWAGKGTSESSIANAKVYIKNDGAVKFGNFSVDTSGTATCSNLSMTGGSINGNDITISAKSISVKSSGTVDFSSASSFSVASGALSFSAISGSSGTSGKITLSNGNISLSSSAGISLASGSISLSGSGSISLASGNITLTGGQIILGSATEGATINGNKIDVNGVGGYVHLRTSNSSYVYLDPGVVDIKGSATSQVIINSTGIAMAGNTISINGRVFDNTNLFARDDIRIVTSSKPEATIISEMTNKHDWVLIKPYYNAEIRYLRDGYYRSTSSGNNTNVVNMPQDGSSGAKAFGQGAGWYKYVLTGTLERQNGETASSGCSFIARLSNSSSLSGGVATTVSVNTTSSNAISFTIDSGTVDVNLCGEGSLIYLRLDTQYTYEKISNLRLTCTCDATTSRVPCTVYYYP